MTYVTHSLGGVAAGLALVHVSGISEPVTLAYVAAGALVGSLLPDIDHTRSKISNKNIITNTISHLVSIFFKHRGFLHTPVFLAILFVVIYVGVGMIPVRISAFHLAAAILLGALSHLILDSLTPGGIMWLWPFTKKKINFASIKTSSISERIFAGAFAVLIAYLFIEHDISSVLF